MLVLILGIVVFLGVHTLTSFRETRTSLISRHGFGPYRAAYSVAALVGLALIIWGFGMYRAGGYLPVWHPPAALRHITYLLVWLAFISFAAANPNPGWIRGRLHHPMLVGLKLWALGHLLVKGDLGSMILFGSFLAWAVFDRIMVKRRGDRGATAVSAFTKGDAIALGGGTLAFIAMIVLHPYLIGVPVMP